MKRIITTMKLTTLLRPNAVCLAIAVLLPLSRAGAQNLLVANPAETSDFRSTFVNPAILSFHESHAAVGAKLYHLGFVEEQSVPFRQGFVSLALPTGISKEMGFGMQAQYFNTPLYSQSNISFVLSRRFKQNYAIGIRFNIFSRSYNRDNFDLVDADDPVFANGTSQWAGTFGAGVAFFPMANLTLAAGVDHINRANISLTNDNVYQPLKGYIGAVLNYGLLQAAVSASYEDGRWLPKTSIGTQTSQIGFLMLGYNEKSLQAEAQLRVTGPLSFNYNYEYTLFDQEGIGGGSHQFSLIHEFDRKKELPTYEIPNELLLDFQPPDQSIRQESKFHVSSSVEKLEIVEKHLKRVIDPELDTEAVAQLSLFDIGVLDSSRTEKLVPFRKDSVDLDLVPAELQASLTENYHRFIGEMSEQLRDGKVEANVVIPKSAYLRAAGLRRQLESDTTSGSTLRFLQPVYASAEDSLLANRRIGQSTVMPQETIRTLSHPTTRFEIMTLSILSEPRSWELAIQNAAGLTVKRFTGTGLPEQELEWDWHDDRGRLVAPGAYQYRLTWRDGKGIEHASDTRYIAIQKLKRTITIEVTKEFKPIGADADEIDIILKK